MLPEEFFDEHLEAEALQRLTPYLTGYRVLLEKKSEPAQIAIRYSFYVRVAPPDYRENGTEKKLPTSQQFRFIKLSVEIAKNASQALLEVFDGAKSAELFSTTAAVDFQNSSGRIEIPSKHFQAASAYLQTADLSYSFAPLKSKKTGKDMAITSNFALSFAIKQKKDGSELSVYLENLAPRTTDRKTSKESSETSNEVLDAKNEPWTISNLLEYEGSLELLGYEIRKEETKHGIRGITSINSVFSEPNQFSDYVIVKETARKIKLSPRTSDEIFSAMVSKFAASRGVADAEATLIGQAISEALTKMNVKFPYTFQEKSVGTIFESIESTRAAVAITARTASGKTLAFVIPIVADAAARRALGDPEGTKALLFYPTHALCHDQADTILKFLWHANLHLKRSGFPHVICMGILHGQTHSRGEAAQEMRKSGTTSIQRELRYKCPECSSRLILDFKFEGGTLRERVVCSGSAGRSDCPLVEGGDPDALSLLNEIIRPSRESVYSAPPDILITTPDMTNLRLFWNPNEQTILGREVKRCTKCGNTSAHVTRRKCEKGWCGGLLEGPIRFSYPRIIVFDEAHQQRGSFGSQVSYVVTRLEKAIEAVNELDKYEPTYIFSSATLRKPEEFIRKFLGRTMDVGKIEAEEVTEEETEPRVHLFVQPKGWSTQATLVQGVREISRHYIEKVGRYPNILVFVNKLSDANELIHLVKDIINDLIRDEFPDVLTRLGPPVIDGHSTDWGRGRAEVEDKFSKGLTHVLIATRGLEVGVDFDRIDALIIYGAPFYVSDYVQRIGRAGRKQPALVVNMCLDKPIDFFFYRQYKVITDASLREKALSAELLNVTRDNNVIRERSIARGILDYLCTRKDSWRYYSETVRGQTGLQNLQTLLSYIFDAVAAKAFMDYFQSGSQKPSAIALNSELKSYLEVCVGNLAPAELNFAIGFCDRLLTALEHYDSLRQVLREGELDGIFFLHKLRDTDYDVEIEYEDLRTILTGDWRRRRALGVAVADYMPNQVTSFRKHFFIVDQVEGDYQEAERIKRSLGGP